VNDEQNLAGRGNELDIFSSCRIADRTDKTCHLIFSQQLHRPTRIISGMSESSRAALLSRRIQPPYTAALEPILKIVPVKNRGYNYNYKSQYQKRKNPANSQKRRNLSELWPESVSFPPQETVLFTFITALLCIS